MRKAGSKSSKNARKKMNERKNNLEICDKEKLRMREEWINENKLGKCISERRKNVGIIECYKSKERMNKLQVEKTVFKKGRNSVTKRSEKEWM